MREDALARRGTAIVQVKHPQVTVSSNPLVPKYRTPGIRRRGSRRPGHPIVGWLRQEIDRRRHGKPASPLSPRPCPSRCAAATGQASRWAMNSSWRRWSVFSGAACCHASRADRGRGDRENHMVSPESVSLPPASGARATPVVATPFDDLGARQIFNSRDPFRHIRNVPSWPGHDDFLPKHVLGKSSAQPAQSL